MTAPAASAPTPTNPGAGPRASAPTARPRTRRNVELGLLIFAMVLILVYTGIVEVNVTGRLTPGFWVPVAMLSVVFFVLHLAIRFLAPYADPVLMPPDRPGPCQAGRPRRLPGLRG